MTSSPPAFVIMLSREFRSTAITACSNGSIVAGDSSGSSRAPAMAPHRLVDRSSSGRPQWPLQNCSWIPRRRDNATRPAVASTFVIRHFSLRPGLWCSPHSILLDPFTSPSVPCFCPLVSRAPLWRCSCALRTAGFCFFRTPPPRPARVPFPKMQVRPWEQRASRPSRGVPRQTLGAEKETERSCIRIEPLSLDSLPRTPRLKRPGTTHPSPGHRTHRG